MNETVAIATAAGLYPLARAWAANSSTTLRPALTWAALALATWIIAALYPQSLLASYLALCLSACAGIAVLGARRPGGDAWNFVVGGLLVVLLMPVATGFGSPRLETAQVVFLGAALSVVLLNHLPTRPGVATPFLVFPFSMELARLAGWTSGTEWTFAGRLSLVVAPWVAWAGAGGSVASTETDRLWLGFRDRYGFLWAQRVREQFNRSSAHAGLNVRLAWSGLRSAAGRDEDAADILRALLKRFNREN